MKQETELKFILLADHLEALRVYLNTLSAEYQPARSLVSTYYETPENLLRQHNTGLRVRHENARYEMTIKLPGRVTGGLHQRPEYNQLITTSQPDLSLFPAEIWPADLTPEKLQSDIQPLFTTEFQRETWHVTRANSRIEIALDQGRITSESADEALCELELELLTGETTDMLDLAQSLSLLPGLRQGGLSKAARGYCLAQPELAYLLKPQAILFLPARSSIEQGFVASLEMALADWLYYEEVWLRGNEDAKTQTQHAIALARHCLTLFSCIIPRKASSQLRDLLGRCDALLSGSESAQQVAFSQENNAARLALIQWISRCGWRAFLDQEARAKLTDSFKRFSDIQLSRVAAELKNSFARPLNHYADQLPRLSRGLDCVHLLSGAYGETRIRGWMENWQLLYQAIVDDRRADIDRYRQLSISQPPFWLHSGKKI